MRMKLAVIDECLTMMQIASKLGNLGVWIISTLKLSRTRKATPPPLPDVRGQRNKEKPGGEIYGCLSLFSLHLSSCRSKVSFIIKLWSFFVSSPVPLQLLPVSLI